MDEKLPVLILGAGGRDFHVFNTCYRNDETRRVVAFTAAQIPHIDQRIYPPVLSGRLYPAGIPIEPEEALEAIIRREGVREAIFAYSDVPFEYLKRLERRLAPLGTKLMPFDVERTMLHVAKPTVAITAVRTGAGKSPLCRRVTAILRRLGHSPVVVRHPMPYGNLKQQIVQRFATVEDFVTHRCTIEEMEEYEPHVRAGNVVFAGVDYELVFDAAAAEGDIVIWDGGNNDTPFLRPDVWITVMDPLRPGHELAYFPGRVNLERADLLVINKVDEAPPEAVQRLRETIARHNPRARIIETRSVISISDERLLRGKRALVVEDGPTTTHGGLGYGAGFVAAQRAGASQIVDPRPFAAGEIAEAFTKYPHLRSVLPALGYGERQIADLQETLNRADCDVVVIGTPVDLTRILRLNKPAVRVTYEMEEAGVPRLLEFLESRLGAVVA